MIKEQEKAIEIIDKMIKSYIEADECGLSNNDFKHEIRAMQTVLSMLQEQQEENKKKDKIINEQLKKDITLQSELNEENNRCMILANNDKFKEQMIDLMSEWISERCFYKDDYSNSCEIIQDSCYKDENCKDCIKQYFGRKVKE